VVTRPLAVTLGLVADQLLGEPPLRPHPVALLGTALQHVERALYADARLPGAVHAAAGVALGAGAGVALRSTAIGTYLSVAGRALAEAARAVDNALATDDLARARSLLPALVGRDPYHLDSGEISRAVVESVAENTVDAVVAPALWAVIAATPGALAHRAINTMDAMIGHRDDRYRRYGWAAARLDDAAAWVPARVTALLVASCRPAAAMRVLRTVRHDAAAHPSPNAGVAEAAFAAALGLRLGGRNYYHGLPQDRPLLGDGCTPRRGDIARAVRLSRDVTITLAALLATAGLVRTVRQ
jgi:adenosylcobinamide-phosphate synthase